MTSLNFKLTTAGQSAAIASGSLNLEITHIQLGSGHKTPDGSETNLLSPGDHSTIGGFVEVEGSPGQNKISANIGGTTAAYAISEIGLWAGEPGANNSTLVFYWSMLSGSVATKTPNVDFNVEADIYFGDATPGKITLVVETTTSLAFFANHNASPDAHAEIINNHNNSLDAHPELFKTPPLGDNDTSVTTSEFVQGTVGGFYQKYVGGGSNVTLDAVEAGHGILKFTGLLTADINVFVPRSPTFKWQIKNATTGAHTLTVKHSTGAGASVTVAQGYNSSLWTDGTNIYESVTIVGFTPVGGIIMWPRPIADIPSNWALCDGTRGTPNLTGTFPFGADADHPIGAIGGSANAVVVTHSHDLTDPGHNHTGDTYKHLLKPAYAGSLTGTDYTGSGSEQAVGPGDSGLMKDSMTGITISSFGETGVNKNLPPYYPLAFIMRIS
ncbi:MAG: hypothetical protein QX198_02000 [Methylococcaceae bacterium]